MKHIVTKLVLMFSILFVLFSATETLFAQTMNEIIFPQYMGNKLTYESLGTVYRIQLQGLATSTSYDVKIGTYFDATHTYGNYCIFDGDNGSPIQTTVTGAGTYTLNAFTTDASGNKNLWLVLYPINQTQFGAGNTGKIRLLCRLSANIAVIDTIFSADSYTMLDISGNTAGRGGVLLVDTASAVGNVQGKFVFAWDNTSGTGRPFSGYVGENNGITEKFYPTNYSTYAVAGTYSFVIPDSNANGVQRLEVFNGDGTSFANDQAVGGFSGTVNAMVSPASDTVVSISSTNAPLPVELSSFSSSVSSLGVNLQWQTATELNSYGFDVERAEVKGSAAPQFSKIGFVKGSGNSSSTKTYSFTDNTALYGNFQYRLKQVDNSGAFKYSQVIEVNNTNKPLSFAVNQNYPNPFNPTTVINYTLPEASMVTLTIYNVLGEKVTTLVNQRQEKGIYNVSFNGMNLPSGIYIYQLSAGKNVISQKMMLLK